MSVLQLLRISPGLEHAALEADFSRIAHVLINSATLVLHTNGSMTSFSIDEIEFYFKSDNHADPYCVCHECHMNGH